MEQNKVYFFLNNFQQPQDLKLKCIRFSIFYYSCPKKSFPSDKYRMSQEECARLQEIVPYVKVNRYNPKHLYPKLDGYGDNGEIILKV